MCEMQQGTQNKDGSSKNHHQSLLNLSLRFTAALTFTAILMERQALKIAFMIGCSCTTHIHTHTKIPQPSSRHPRLLKKKIQAKNNKMEIARQKAEHE